MASSRLSLVKTTGDDGFDRPLKISISTGGGLHKVKGKTVTWGQLVARLTTDKRTDMTQKKYDGLTADAKQKEKMRAGFLFGGLCENGHRANANVQSRALVNLDIDDITPSEFANFKFECGDPDANPLNRFEYVWYTTRSHTPEKPKFRIIVPLLESCDPDKYIAIARITGSKLDSSMKLLDTVSFVLGQMMYWPLTNSDGHFESGRNRGAFTDADAELEAFGDWHDFSKLPCKEDEDLSTMRGRGAKQASPFEKTGIIGAFNRAYSIEDAINDFLPDVYEKTISTDKNERYTYLKSSTGQTGGMIAYPDEGLMFSHHSSDPCGNGHEYNAFDMVRVHLFGDLDQGLKIDNPTRTKSFREMERFLENDKGVRQEMMKENYDFEAMVSDAFADDAVKPAAKPAQQKKTPVVRDELDDDEPTDTQEQQQGTDDDERDELGNIHDWTTTLEMDKNGVIEPTTANLMKIFTNDPRIKGSIALNEFRRKIVKMKMFPDGALGKAGGRLLRDCPVIDDINGELWEDMDDDKIKLFLSLPRGKGEDRKWYGLQPAKETIVSGLSLAAYANRFNPVKQMFEKTKWDGTPRLDSLFIDYLGTPDTEYSRLSARLTLIAAIDRVYYPGSKYDYVPILEGPQGIQKSTFIRILANDWFAELRGHDLEDNRKMAELFEGALFIEIPELHSFSRAEATALKSFFSGVSDKARAAFDRRVSENRRMVVFWGSTNERTYLKDKTGNRRFLPIICRVDDIDIAKLKVDRWQLWAEAYHYWLEMRADSPYGDLPLFFPRGSEAAAIAKTLQDEKSIDTSADQHAGSLEQWLDELAQSDMANCNQPKEIGVGAALDTSDINPDMLVRRDQTCILEIAARCHLFSDRSIDRRLSQEISEALGRVKGWRSIGRVRTRGYGQQRIYVRIGGKYDVPDDEI